MNIAGWSHRHGGGCRGGVGVLGNGEGIGVESGISPDSAAPLPTEVSVATMLSAYSPGRALRKLETLRILSANSLSKQDDDR